MLLNSKYCLTLKHENEKENIVSYNYRQKLARNIYRFQSSNKQILSKNKLGINFSLGILDFKVEPSFVMNCVHISWGCTIVARLRKIFLKKSKHS